MTRRGEGELISISSDDMMLPAARRRPPPKAFFLDAVGRAVDFVGARVLRGGAVSDGVWCEMKVAMKVEKKSLAGEVSDLIRSRIASGEMPVGAKLPPEKELSDIYGVGRSTIREAVSVLSNIGLLRVMQGRGTFVVSQHATNEPIAQRLKRAQSCDLDEIRQILEMKIAEKAAQKRTKRDLKNIEARLAEIDAANASGDLEKSIDADIKFHTALAEASHNEILLEFYGLASEHLRKWYARIYKSSEIFGSAFGLHRELVELIRRGDSAGAWRVAEEIIKHGRT